MSVKSFFAVFVLCCLCFPAFGWHSLEESTKRRNDSENQPTKTVSLPIDGNEVGLKLDYQVSCEEGAQFRGITGTVEYAGRKIRFELFSMNRSIEVFLGKHQKGVKDPLIRFDPNPRCKLVELKASSVDLGGRDLPKLNHKLSDELNALVMKHMPFIGVRPDQRQNRYTDLPLHVSYSLIENKDGGFTLVYTFTFSDEDSLTTVKALEGQMGRYGRRTDLEWLYQVRFDKDLKPVETKFHGGLFKNAAFGHGTYDFSGEKIGGNHPLLYVCAKNNICADKSKANEPVVGYHLVPRTRVDFPQSRVRVMIQNPWMSQVSDDELRREKKLHKPFDEYLYVRVEVSEKATFGKFSDQLKSAIRLRDGEGEEEKIVGGTTIDRIGHDLFWRRSYSALPVGKQKIRDILAGKTKAVFDFEKIGNPKVKVKELKFYRVVKDKDKFSYQDITKFIRQDVTQK